MTVQKNKFSFDDIGLIVIGFGASLMYFISERIIHANEELTVYFVIIGILVFSIFTQFLINKIKKSQLKLVESEKKYRLLAENATDIIWTLNQNFAFTYVSPSIVNSGYSVDEVMGMDLSQMLTPASRDAVVKLFKSHLVASGEKERHATESFEYQQVFKDGSAVWMEARAAFFYDKSGDLVGVQCASRDITWRKQAEEALRRANETLEQKVRERTAELQESNRQLNEEVEMRRKTEEQLRESENKYRAIFENTGAATVIVDREMIISLANTEFENITQYKKEEVEGAKSLLEFIDMNEFQKMIKIIDAYRSGAQKEIKNFETVFINKLGKKKNILISFDEIQGMNQYVASISDITELKEAEKQIQYQAFHDFLTNLPNRALFMDHLNMSVKRKKRNQEYLYAVLYLDIDRFKIVNDSLGHVVGDRLLVALARRLKECLRDIDTVARMGGDEFAILLEDIEAPEFAIFIAERIQKAMEVPFTIEAKDLYTTVSIGIVVDTRRYEIVEHIIRDADAAMYYAKEDGRAKFKVFDTKMHERAMFLLQMENDLRKAIEKNEFEMYYQPIVSVEGRKLLGFESLIRWNHPVLGRIGPDMFIPTAEETGMIIPIGKWVLEESCRQLGEFQKLVTDDTRLFMSVNVSRKQLADRRLIEEVRDLLQRTGLAPEQLKLEITESIVMSDTESAIDSLYKLKEQGVHIAIDDFGTGYSSLSYLQQLPIDTLKVDRSFVSRMADEGTDVRKIVEAIVTLAHRLGLDVIAEGVETDVQHSILSVLKCQNAQGYLFGKPMERSMAEEMIQKIDPSSADVTKLIEVVGN